MDPVRNMQIGKTVHEDLSKLVMRKKLAGQKVTIKAEAETALMSYIKKEEKRLREA